MKDRVCQSNYTHACKNNFLYDWSAQNHVHIMNNQVLIKVVSAILYYAIFASYTYLIYYVEIYFYVDE